MFVIYVEKKACTEGYESKEGEKKRHEGIKLNDLIFSTIST